MQSGTCQKGCPAYLLAGFWGSSSELLGPKYWDTESDMVPYTRLAPSCAKPMTRPKGLEGTLRSLSFLRTSSFFCAMASAYASEATLPCLPSDHQCCRCCSHMCCSLPDLSIEPEQPRSPSAGGRSAQACCGCFWALGGAHAGGGRQHMLKTGMHVPARVAFVPEGRITCKGAAPG